MYEKLMGLALLGILGSAGMLALLMADEPRGGGGIVVRWLQHDRRRPHPPVVEPAKSATAVPGDATILFNGHDLDEWQGEEGKPARWKVVDGAIEVVPGTGRIATKGKFGDVQLHIEWASPVPAEGKGQDRGNSGIFLMGQYELQVLDSYQADTYADGQAGAIYGQYPPLANATRPPGEWQTYDIAFRRPRFGDNGTLLERARITMIHNGILVQNNEELLGPTNWLETGQYEPDPDKGPIELQDHGHRVKFRNIWIRELADRPMPPAGYPDRPKTVELSADVLDSLVGQYASDKNKDSKPVQITRAEGHLLLKMASRPRPLTLLAISPNEFVLPRTDGQFRFERRSDGAVSGFVLRVGDGEQTMTKLSR